MSQGKTQGRFVWYELMTPDMKAAEKFYPAVTGWSVEDWKGSDMPYQLWKAGDTAVGGSMELPQEARAMGAPPQWMAHVGVSDVDGACRKIEKAGGRIVKQPEEIPKVGRFAVVADPQGAVLAIFSPAEGSGPGPQGEPVPGTFSWHELVTTDLDSAVRFYTELFGWEETDSFDMGEMGPYRMFGAGGRVLGGMFRKPDTMPGPPRWTYYVLVADIEQAVEAVRKGGGQVLNGPMEVPGGDLVAQCMDPQGAAFALHAKKK